MISLPFIILAVPLRAAAPIITAPQAPLLAIPVIRPAIASGMSVVLPLTPVMPSPLAPSPFLTTTDGVLAPTALRSALLAAAVADPKISVENAAASGEKLIALLQGRDPLARVKINEIVPGVLHMAFPSQRLMATTMVRFQEHYESPKFRGKIFTRAEFDAWYAKQNRPGNVSYYKYWDGFNVPSRILKPFKQGSFDPLDPKEQSLLARVSARKDPFYLIATSGKKGNPTILRHELAHGLWYTRPDYRRRARALLRNVNLKPVFKMLSRLKYHESVWLDEAHAWLGDPASMIRSEGLNSKPYAALRKRLLALQKEYASGVF